ncbi:Tmprss12 [Acrasis kona]|uniref:Tmprss12 n=1 Tax=Acrasis kona TaxID=1008807 RepID=A0AAW2YHA0_9EUKA
MVNPGQSNTYACGGGIISKRYVMTAGHCSFGDTFQVITGRIDVHGYHLTDLVNVNRVVKPTDYASLGFDYDDIAIFELAKDVEEVPDYIQYLDIGLNAPPVNQPLTIAGFGQLANAQDTSKAHFGTIHVSPDDQCHFSSYQPSKAFCSATAEVYSCPGDSGTPIVVKPAGATRWVSVGIDSYGHEGPCGNKEYDSIIAKVASMIDFIRDNTLLAPPNFVNLNFASNGAVTGSTAAPVAGHQDPHPDNCWTCPPGYVHWWEAGLSTYTDPCGCVAGVATTTSSPTTPTTTTSSPATPTTTSSSVSHPTNCWTCPAGYVHWWEAGLSSSSDPCGCVVQSATANCPSGWTKHNNYCYKLFTSTVSTYYDSRQACKNQGGNLASITSLELNNWVNSFVSTNCAEFWIGGSRSSNTEAFKWDDGNSFTFTNFDSNEPKSSNNFVSFIHGTQFGTVGKWRAITNLYKKPFLCERSPQ